MATGEDEVAVHLRAGGYNLVVSAFAGERLYDGKVSDDIGAEECSKGILDRIDEEETSPVRPNAGGDKVASPRGVLAGCPSGATGKPVVEKDNVATDGKCGPAVPPRDPLQDMPVRFDSQGQAMRHPGFPTTRFQNGQGISDRPRRHPSGMDAHASSVMPCPC